MADTTTLVLLNPRPLITADAAGLEADVVPKALWQPIMLLESDQTVEIPLTGLAADEDLWRVLFCPVSATPGVVYLPLRLRFSIWTSGGSVAFPTLFEKTYQYAIDVPIGGNSGAWYNADMLDPREYWAGVGGEWSQTGAPEIHGWPPKAGVALDPDSIQNNCLGGITLQIQTYDATSAAASKLSIDSAWVGYPVNALRSAGFYTPRMYFNGQ